MSKSKQILGIAFIILLAIAAAYIMSGCKTTKETQSQTLRIDSVVTVKRDTTYYSKDSIGKTYTIETIKEYHTIHDTVNNFYHNVLTKEIIREAGQIVQVNTDSGRMISIDSLSKILEQNNKSKTVETETGWPAWLTIVLIISGVMAALIIYKKFFA